MAFKILAICLLVLLGIGFVQRYFQMQEWEKQNAEAQKKFQHEQWVADLTNASTVRFCQDGKSSVFITDLDQSRPIFLYDIEQNILMGVIPGKGHNFIAERKAIPANQ